VDHIAAISVPQHHVLSMTESSITAKCKVHQPLTTEELANVNFGSPPALLSTNKEVSFPSASVQTAAMLTLGEILQKFLRDYGCAEEENGENPDDNMTSMFLLVQQTEPECWPLCREFSRCKDGDSEESMESILFRHVVSVLLSELTKENPVEKAFKCQQGKANEGASASRKLTLSSKQVLDVAHVVIDVIKEECGQISESAPIESNWMWKILLNLHYFLKKHCSLLEESQWKEIMQAMITILPKLGCAGHQCSFVERFFGFLWLLKDENKCLQLSDDGSSEKYHRLTHTMLTEISKILPEGTEQADGLLSTIHSEVYLQLPAAFCPRNCPLRENRERQGGLLAQHTKEQRSLIIQALKETLEKYAPDALDGSIDIVSLVAQIETNGSLLLNEDVPSSVQEMVETGELLVSFKECIGRENVVPFFITLFKKMLLPPIVVVKRSLVARFLRFCVYREIGALAKEIGHTSPQRRDAINLFGQIVDRFLRARKATLGCIEWDKPFQKMVEIIHEMGNNGYLDHVEKQMRELYVSKVAQMMEECKNLSEFIEIQTAMLRTDSYHPEVELWQSLSDSCRNACLHGYLGDLEGEQRMKSSLICALEESSLPVGF